MASKEKRKSDKKAAKKYDENINKSAIESQEFNTEEYQKQPDPIIVEVPLPEEQSIEPIYEEPILAKLIITSFEGEKVKGLYEGIGEAQFVDGHSYKGMFSQGYMHGKGVYIWSDGTSYEGDFVKNQITGNGMYVWKDGSTYVGGVLNSKRHGYGTFQSADETKTYTGDWHLGYREGKGRMDYDILKESYYDGDWKNGIKHGWGVRRYPSGNVYIGMWFNNVRHGEGTMRWLDRDQMYFGQWENGIQHGMGQHIWLLHRVHKSQYPLRNMYSGELANGKRHGQGIFYYANGARYEGDWKDNMKHGKGKFTFKNGRIYEGMFENDHIVEYPDFSMDGLTTPDLSKIRTRTPIPADNLSIHSNESRNTVSPSFQLDINTLLATLNLEDNENEISQVMYAITRNISALHRIYTFYSALGYHESPDNTFIMSKMQFWIFLKDIYIHHSNYTLTDVDRLIATNYHKSNVELHNPYEKILLRQFVNYLIIIAHLLYSKDHSEKKETGPLLEYCFSRLMRERVLYRACKVKSTIYFDIKRAINVLVHMDQTYEIYQAISTARKHPPREPVLKMRQFLLLLKELKLLNHNLTPQAVIQVLASGNPIVDDGEGCFNLELEMSFLEFFEALVGCAEHFVTERVVANTTTSHASETLISETSFISISPSRIASQLIEDEGAASNRNSEVRTPMHPMSEKMSMAVVRSQKSGIDKVARSISSPFKDISAVKITSRQTKESAVESLMIDHEEEAKFIQLDESTKKFNFWTHQIHIFFVLKFFPRAKKYIQIKKFVEARRLEDAKMKLMSTPENDIVESSESLTNSKTELLEELESIAEDTAQQ